MKKYLYLFLLKSIAVLPLAVLYLISDFMTLVLHYLLGYRKKIIRRNLEASFPDKSIKEIKRIEKGFYRFLSDQIVETVKLFHISDKELQKRVKVENYEEINQVLESGNSVVLMMGHYGNWEWAQEISRYFLPVYQASIYHPLNNKEWNKIFIGMRSRWGAHILPMKQATRRLLDHENRPWVCGFIADQWTNKKHEDNKIEFLNQPTWFIYGPEEIGERVGAEFFYLDFHVEGRGRYRIEFRRLTGESYKEPYPISRQFWSEFQKTIERAPAYWLWSHKRWK